jgi:hypothetical protein
MRRRLAALALGLCCIAATPIASAGPPGRWTRLSTDTGVANFAEPALGRSADGSLHVLWVEEDGAGGEDLLQARISTDGTVTLAQSPVITDWSGMWAGGGDLVTMPDGTLRYFFGGDGNPVAPTNNNLSMLSSDAAGTTWTLMAGNVVNIGDSNARASTIGAGISNEGAPFQSWGATYHRGTDRNIPPINLHQRLNWGCCSFSSDIATNAVTGQMYLGWETQAEETLPDGTRERRYGVWAHEIDPVSGQPIGSVMQMPSVNETPPGSVSSYDVSDTRMPMTGRPGFDGVWVGHQGGYQPAHSMLVWKIGDDFPITAGIPGPTAHSTPAIASDDNGRLWVGFTARGRLYIKHSNIDPDRLIFGSPAILRVPRGTTAITDLKISAQDHLLDVVAVLDTASGAPAIWHTQVYPALTVTPHVNHFRGRERIRFQVTDVVTPVAGAVVRAGGRSARTNADGMASIVLGPYERRQSVPITASKDGYTPGRSSIFARPAR